MTDTALPAVYQRIAANLLQQLDSGHYPPGSRLPSVRALAAEHGVNVLTALAAYRLAKDQNLIATTDTEMPA